MLNNFLSRAALRRMLVGLVVLVAVLGLNGCLTTTARRAVPPPWVPSEDEAAYRDPPIDEVAPVFWLEPPPVIDGIFDEWDDLTSAEPYVSVYGGGHDPEDASGRFTVATDGANLYLFAQITDDVANENPLTPAMAWRNDSVEFFFGTETARHRTYAPGDTQIRVVPVSRSDESAYALAINDVDMTRQTRAAVRFTASGYTLEAAVDLALLQIAPLKMGKKVRVEFQINDGDQTERDRLIHWMSEKDDPWFDASSWGNGVVVTLEEVNRD